MARYVKKPYVIEAIRFVQNDFDQWTEWAQKAVDEGKLKYVYDITGTPLAFEVTTIDGNIARGNRGSYLIKGIKNDLYPCDGSIFEETYTKVGDWL